jgi:hypothetical protein
VAISPETLRLTADLRSALGSIADSRTRALAKAWATAWDSISPLVLSGVTDLLADVEAGKIPTRAQLVRSTRLLRALDVAEGELARLSRVAGMGIAKDVTEAVETAATQQDALIASQFPPAEGTTAELAVKFDKLNPRQLVAITTRVSGQVTSLLYPLSAASYQAMTRSLLTGVALGSNPREIAARMVRGVEGGFTGGLTRALTIARTETLDSSRAAAREAHLANSDVLSGWQWSASLDRRCCPSCWSKHGNKYPLDVPGPLDHQQGRCARVPVAKTWAELGFSATEPPSAMPDAQAVFRAMSKADQLAVMGPARLAALDSGKASWADLAQRKRTTGWRDSYSVRPVKDLLAGARSGAADTHLPSPDRAVVKPATAQPPTRPTPSTTWKTAASGEDVYFRAQSIQKATARLQLDRTIRPREVQRVEESIRSYGASPEYAAQEELPTDYVRINSALRAGKGDIPGDAPAELRQVIEDVDNLIEASPLRYDAIVHRGMQNSAVAIPGWPGAGDAVGLEWSAWGFQSTSVSEGAARDFATGLGSGATADEPVIMRALVPEGTPGLQMDDSLEEVLLPRNTTYRVVVDNGVVNGIRRIDVEVIRG